MAQLVINFAAGGDDELASGAGPQPAINNVTEGTTASWSGTTVTFSGATDLTNVVTDGTHALYLQTSTGRRFFTIIGKDTNQVTVAETIFGDPAGLNWAIGGNRLDFNTSSSRTVFADLLEEWVVAFSNDQTVSSTIMFTGSVLPGGTDVFPTLRGIGNPTLTMTANDNLFECPVSSAGHIFEGFRMTNTSGGSSAHGWQIANSNTNLYFRNLEVDNFARGVDRTVGVIYAHIYRCFFHDCRDYAFRNLAGSGTLNMQYSAIWNNGGGVYSTTNTGHTLIGNVISNNGTAGLRIGGPANTSANLANHWNVSFNTFDNNGGHGMELLNNAPEYTGKNTCDNNIFSNNGGYGIGLESGWSGALDPDRMLDTNAYYNNTLGDVAPPLTTGLNAITGQNPQYTNAGAGDYSINNEQLMNRLRALGPSNSYWDCGAVQEETTGGGGGPSGGLLVHQGMVGGIRG